MIRCIIFDVDGTLRHEQKGIPPSIQAVIKACKKQHILVGICTGRTYAMIQNDVYKLMFDFYISGDGSQIKIGDALIQNLFIDPAIVNDIIQKIQACDGCALETESFTFMNQKACQELISSNQKKGLLNHNQEKIRYQDTFKYYNLDMPVHKICIWSQEAQFKRDDVSYAQQIDISPYYYEIIHPDAGKGKAICTLKKHLDIQTEEILCFGDGLNDISMFQACGHKVAMKNSAEALLQYADHICEDIFENGIYNELIRRKVICI